MQNKKIYAIDIVSELVRNLSGSEPAFFQRDECFFAASTVGFGWVEHGLSTLAEDPEGVKGGYIKEKPEIIDSKDITYMDQGEFKGDKTRRVINEEVSRVRPILFGRDTDSFTLKDIAKAVESFTKNSDDKKIRLVSHWNSYRSHKYGYAADGMDFGLGEARVMDRERYFELMREREERLLSGLEEISRLASEEGEYNSSNKDIIEMAYDGTGTGRMCPKPYAILDAFVITPDFLINFPRKGQLSYHNRNESWSDSSEFNAREGIVKFGEISTGYKSPFSFHYRLNSSPIIARKTDEFTDLINQSNAKITRGVSAILNVMPQIEQYVERLNNMNDIAFRKEIKRHEKLVEA